jgi:hypothetical protein
MDFDCTLLQDQYNFWVGTSRENRYLNLGDAERYWFAGGRNISWRDCVVDENLAPASHTQARNPTWSNYRWNQQDIFAEMLAGSSADSQDKAKLGLFVRTRGALQTNTRLRAGAYRKLSGPLARMSGPCHHVAISSTDHHSGCRLSMRDGKD